MKQYRLGAGAGTDRLTLVEQPAPTPARGQILLRMRAASLNYRDLLVLERRYPGAPETPFVPLSDGAGEVIAIGPDVTRFAVGDRVCPTFFRDWTDGEIGAERAAGLGAVADGVLAEQLLVDEHYAVKAPDHLSWEEAACLPCAAVTAWVALNGDRPLRAGETVLTLGTGGVSMFAIQFAKAAGARVIATSSSESKLAIAQRCGADDMINYSTQPGWDAAARALTNGRGVDHVVEIGGAGTLPRSIAATAPGGQIHLVGVLTRGTIDPIALLPRKTLRGIYVGGRLDFERMNRMLALHQLRPVVDRVFAFDDVAAAYRHLSSASHIGKIVIRCDELGAG